jgi:hypothetical protein
VSVADSICATTPARYGAHNGWRARGDQDITVAIATDPSIAVYTHGGQPGTIWDMFGVKFDGGRYNAAIKVVNLGNQEIQQHIFGDISKRQIVGEFKILFK